MGLFYSFEDLLFYFIPVLGFRGGFRGWDWGWCAYDNRKPRDYCIFVRGIGDDGCSLKGYCIGVWNGNGKTGDDTVTWCLKLD